MSEQRYVPPLEDMRFLLEEVFDASEVFGTGPYPDVDTQVALAVLEQAGRFTAEVLGPVNAEGDATGSRLVDGAVRTPPGFGQAYRRYCEAGWVGLDLPQQYGGQGLPLVIQAGVAEMVTGSCMAFSMLPLMGAQRLGCWLDTRKRRCATRSSPGWHRERGRRRSVSPNPRPARTWAASQRGLCRVSTGAGH